MYYYFFGVIPFGTNANELLKQSIKLRSTEVSNYFAYATFELIAGGNRFNPLDYTNTLSGTCSLGFSEICALDVLTSAEVYTMAEAIVKGNSAFAGKPKVDTAGSSLETDINDALAYTISIWYLAPNGRMVYKRP